MTAPLRANTTGLSKVHRAVAINQIGDIVSRLKNHKARPQNRCAMIIDGEAVWVDIDNYDVQMGQLAVILDYYGCMRLEVVDPITNGFKPMGERSALGPKTKTPHGTTIRNTVIVVGIVLRADCATQTIEGRLA